MVSQYKAALMSGLLTMPSFNEAIDHANGTRLGLLTAGYPLGMLLSLQLSAWTSDRYGRRFAICCGAVVVIVGTLFQGLTRGPWVLLGSRILLGIGTSFEIVAAPTLVAEIAHPRTRAQASALTQTCYYSKQQYCFADDSRCDSCRLGLFWYTKNCVRLELAVANCESRLGSANISFYKS